jgi:uncharacterized membrane protein
MRKKQNSDGSNAADLARGLGWFSLGLGAAQVLAPRAVGQVIGVRLPPLFMVLCGLREIACGIGILSGSDTRAWMKARVAGDALDLAALGAAWVVGGNRGNAAVATAAVAGVTALDVYCSEALDADVYEPPMHVRTSIAVNRPREELYAFWRDFTNLPRVMPHLRSVSITGADRSHWIAQGPGGISVEWDAEIIDDKPNERLAWRSLDGADVYNAGSVRFDPAPAGRGTYVTVELLYEPPAGSISATLAKFFGRDVGQETRADLRAFKQLMETGEIATTHGQPVGRAGRSLYDRLARIAT